MFFFVKTRLFFVVAVAASLQQGHHVNRRPRVGSRRVKACAVANNLETKANSDEAEEDSKLLARLRVDESDVIGGGTYGSIFAASDPLAVKTTERYVAKRARSDPLSQKYFDVEAAINEKLNEKLYVGVKRDKPKSKGFFESLTAGMNERPRYLIFRRVPGRDLKSYVEEGACGVDALAAALGAPHCSNELDECPVDWSGDACSADPDAARASAANLAVAILVLASATKSVASVHAAGVCHRDVKPANLVVDPASQTVHLIDFGSAFDVETKLGLDAKRSENPGVL